MSYQCQCQAIYLLDISIGIWYLEDELGGGALEWRVLLQSCPADAEALCNLESGLSILDIADPLYDFLEAAFSWRVSSVLGIGTELGHVRPPSEAGFAGQNLFIEGQSIMMIMTTISLLLLAQGRGSCWKSLSQCTAYEDQHCLRPSFISP